MFVNFDNINFYNYFYMCFIIIAMTIHRCTLSIKASSRMFRHRKQYGARQSRYLYSIR